MKYLLFSLVIIASFSACKEDEPETVDYFNGTVLQKGMDCGDAYLIQFEAGQEGLPENQWEGIFYEINLDSTMRVEDLKVKVKFRDPIEAESMICTAMGPGYPQIYVVHAVRR